MRRHTQLGAQKSWGYDTHRQGLMRGHWTETQATSWEKGGQEGQTRAARTVVLRQAQRHKWSQESCSQRQTKGPWGEGLTSARTVSSVRQEENTDLPLCCSQDRPQESSDLLLTQRKKSPACTPCFLSVPSSPVHREEETLQASKEEQLRPGESTSPEAGQTRRKSHRK